MPRRWEIRGNFAADKSLPSNTSQPGPDENYGVEVVYDQELPKEFTTLKARGMTYHEFLVEKAKAYARNTSFTWYLAMNDIGSTTITDNPLTSGATSIHFASTGNMTASQTVVTIENEQILIGTKANPSVGCIRHINGTLPSSHVNGSTVTFDFPIAVVGLAAGVTASPTHEGSNFFDVEVKVKRTDFVASLAGINPNEF